MTHSDASSLFGNRNFVALLIAQLLGYLNDNIFKMMASLLAVGMASKHGGALSLASIIFLAPYLLFSGYAGYAADAFGNRRVLVATKVVELVIVVLAIWALGHGRIEPVLLVLFLLAGQATFFSPAKYSIVPALVPLAQLQRANGLLEISRFGAIIVGTALGGFMLNLQALNPTLAGAVLLAISIAGLAAARRISRTGSTTPGRSFRVNPWAEVGAGIRMITRRPRLRSPVIGLCCFEAIGALLMLDTILIGHHALDLGDASTSMLAAFVGVGLAAGSLLAGQCARRTADIGMAPYGIFGVAVIVIVTVLCARSFITLSAAMVGVGLCGAFCLVPLNADLQRRARSGERGQIIATSNFLSMAGVLAASLLLWLLWGLARLSPWTILLLCGLAALGCAALMVLRFPGYAMAARIWGGNLLRLAGARGIRAAAGGLMLIMSLALASPQSAEASPTATTSQIYRVTHSLFGEVGTFTQSITHDGDRIVVDSHLDVQVTVLFSKIVLHEVRSTVREIWSAGRLLTYDSVTLEDGELTEIHGRAEDDAFTISGPSGEARLPADISSLTRWSIALTHMNLLLSPETGRLRRVAITGGARQRLDLGNGPVLTTHFIAHGDESFELWYDKDEHLVKLELKTATGKVSFLRP
jgi:MFS family permease